MRSRDWKAKMIDTYIIVNLDILDLVFNGGE